MACYIWGGQFARDTFCARLFATLLHITYVEELVFCYAFVFSVDLCPSFSVAAFPMKFITLTFTTSACRDAARLLILRLH